MLAVSPLRRAVTSQLSTCLVVTMSGVILLSGLLDPGRLPQKVPTAWNTGPVQQGGESVSLVVQERVRKFFDLYFNTQNWSWLLDPVRSEVPPTAPRPPASAGDEAAMDPLVEEEAKSLSGNNSLEPVMRPRKHPSREGKLKRGRAPPPSRASGRDQVSVDRDFAFEFRQVLTFV